MIICSSSLMSCADFDDKSFTVLQPLSFQEKLVQLDFDELLSCYWYFLLMFNFVVVTALGRDHLELVLVVFRVNQH